MEGDEFGLSKSVVLGDEFVVVDGAVDFDDESMGSCVEVDDVATDWMLSTKLDVVKTPVSQRFPEYLL